MGLGLEPVIGLLRYSISVLLTAEDDICKPRVTKNLLQLVDPDYANVLEQCVPSLLKATTSPAHHFQGVHLCHSTRYPIY
jgi:hypothetical protein